MALLPLGWKTPDALLWLGRRGGGAPIRGMTTNRQPPALRLADEIRATRSVRTRFQAL